MRVRLKAWALALGALLVLTAGSAQAAPGDLDPSFGTGGKVTTAFGSNDEAHAVALQPDGKIVAAGQGYNGSGFEFALARYNADGSLDSGFNGSGKATTPFGSSGRASSVALQPDGKIVAAGRGDNGSQTAFALARYNTDGSLDSSFGAGGKVTTAIGSNTDNANAVALAPDGKIVAAGASYNGTQYVFALARYNTDGSLDTSFNTTGKATTAIGSIRDIGSAVVVQPDKKVIIAGASDQGLQYMFALARYNENGSLDSGFGSGGKVTTAIGSSGIEAIQGIALQPDGKIVAAGYANNGSNNDFALARYNADGSLDSSFGSGGKVTTQVGSGDDFGNAVALQTDGKIVAAGYSHNGTNNDFALARYNADASLDTGFGMGGKVTTAIGSGNDIAFGAVFQPDGKIVAAGYGTNGTSTEFALARYLGITLTVAKAGSGSGTLSSSPAGIDCGTTCSAGFADGTSVTVTATPSSGSSFTGWSGDCSGTSTCDLTMSADHAATATFETDKTLTITKAGSGTGTVSSGPAGIDCGSTCSHAYAHGTSVTLSATASAGSTFTGWSGDCTGTGTCSLTMSADHAATATFESDKTLTVSKAGAGSGTVSSSPAGISCGSSCTHAYTHGTSVTLTAAASSRSKFAGWSGDCSGTGACTLTMSTDRSATARFQPKCIVPKVKGKRLRAAKRAIRRAHCSVGKVRKAFSARVKKGRVISQKPAPGKRLAAGSKVNLKVSKGRKP